MPLTVPIKPMDGIAQALEREAERADWLVLWLDCDREGENIAFEVIDVCRKAHARRNRRAELRVLRAHFSVSYTHLRAHETV